MTISKERYFFIFNLTPLSNISYTCTETILLNLFFMNNSTIISIFLAFLFLAKFLAIDSNGLMLFNDNGKINYINTHCKKLNPPKKIANFSKSNTSETHNVILPVICSQQFIVETFSEEATFLLTKSTLNTIHKTTLSYLYLEHVVPPPRV